MQAVTNASELKQREHGTWTGVAPGWRTHDERLVRSAAPATARMLDLLGLTPGMQLLDIACGTGEPAIPAAERVGPTGHVVATDFVEEMLQFARGKAVGRNVSNIEFGRVDGEELDFAPAGFDAVSIRWGLMFMPDPVECLRRAHRVLKQGGRIAVACWAQPDRNPWVSIPMGIIRRRLNAPPPAPGTPGIFAFADEARLRAALEEAGFRVRSVEAVDLTMADFDTGNEFFTFLRELAGPVAALYAQLPPDAQVEARDEIVRAVTGPDGRVMLPGVTWVAAAEK
jgi:ubiquinone/menaquinone biosynthesis C-methylase UbiE